MESVSQWIDGLRVGDDGAADHLWRRYVAKLVTLSRHRLPPHARRAFDEEDVAISAFHSLCDGMQKGRFDRLDNREDLWALLVVITARKAARRIRGATAVKRGGGDAQGESAGGADGALLAGIIGEEPSPDFAAEIDDEVEHLLGLLKPALREVAILKFAGMPNADIARQLDCGARTVERRMMLIRQIWSERGDDHE